eukprot:767924-Hanusia_phi.AAC.3
MARHTASTAVLLEASSACSALTGLDDSHSKQLGCAPARIDVRAAEKRCRYSEGGVEGAAGGGSGGGELET